MQRLNSSLTRNQSIIFTSLTVLGVLALLLGLILIIFAQYHERAYVFLGLGAASFIAGMAGLVGAASNLKTALSYGGIAIGMMGIIVGLNYLTNRYGPGPNQTHGYIVIALSIIAILAGIVGALITQPERGLTAFSSVVMLGVIASIGVVALIVGTVYLVVLEHQAHAYPLFVIGAVCLIGGILCGRFAQSRARTTSR